MWLSPAIVGDVKCIASSRPDGNRIRKTRRPSGDQDRGFLANPLRVKPDDSRFLGNNSLPSGMGGECQQHRYSSCIACAQSPPGVLILAGCHSDSSISLVDGRLLGPTLPVERCPSTHNFRNPRQCSSAMLSLYLGLHCLNHDTTQACEPNHASSCEPCMARNFRHGRNFLGILIPPLK